MAGLCRARLPGRWRDAVANVFCVLVNELMRAVWCRSSTYTPMKALAVSSCGEWQRSVLDTGASDSSALLGISARAYTKARCYCKFFIVKAKTKAVQNESHTTQGVSTAHRRLFNTGLQPERLSLNCSFNVRGCTMQRSRGGGALRTHRATV